METEPRSMPQAPEAMNMAAASAPAGYSDCRMRSMNRMAPVAGPPSRGRDHRHSLTPPLKSTSAVRAPARAAKQAESQKSFLII
jgi:hypothetical protein